MRSDDNDTSESVQCVQRNAVRPRRDARVSSKGPSRQRRRRSAFIQRAFVPTVARYAVSVNGNDISPPKGFGDGVNVRISGSNIHFGRYLDLTQSAFESVGVNEWYFYNPEDSTLIDAERYVRIHENRSGPIHGRAGPIAGLAHLLENDRQGSASSFRTTTTNRAAICPDTTNQRNVPGSRTPEGD